MGKRSEGRRCLITEERGGKGPSSKALTYELVVETAREEKE